MLYFCFFEIRTERRSFKPLASMGEEITQAFTSMMTAWHDMIFISQG